jgi:hypothetical protein
MMRSINERSGEVGRYRDRRLGWAAVGLGALALSACTSVQTEDQYAGAKLPRPDVILVSVFAVSPDEVDLDRAPGADLMRAVEGTPRTKEEIDAGHQVARALAQELVYEIKDLGLNAQLSDQAPTAGQQAVEIEGQFVSVDEGNRAERMIIGFGAGRSDVVVDVQVYGGQDGSQLLEKLSVDAKSGLKPGIAETFPVGAVAGSVVVAAAVSTTVAVGSEEFGANVVADSDRAAKGIAKHLAVFFAEQGWITKS